MMTKVNAIGDACPLPVIKTKNALAEMGQGDLEVLVDNDVAVQNIQRFAQSAGCLFEVEKQDDHFRILLKKAETPDGADQTDLQSELPSATGNTVVILPSEIMGSGDEELGKILMKGFVFALTQLNTLPDVILLYNTGARLSVKNAATLEDLLSLEKAGVRIMTCGTCLNHLGLSEDLAVGQVTNMYSIVEEMQAAARILRP